MNQIDAADSKRLVDEFIEYCLESFFDGAVNLEESSSLSPDKNVSNSIFETTAGSIKIKN